MTVEDPNIAAVGEVAKATGEVAKVTGAVVKAATANRDLANEAAKASPGHDVLGKIRNENLMMRSLIENTVLKGIVRKFFHDNEYVTSGEIYQDLASKLEGILRDQLQPPKESIAGPAMEGLTYTLDEPPLKDMYLNLLAAASNRATARRVHPSFVEILRQLSAEEVPALDQVLRAGRTEAAKPGIMLRANSIGYHYAIPREDRAVFSCILRPDPNGVLGAPDVAVWVANWERLGIVELVLDHELISFTLPNCPGWVLANEQARRANGFVQAMTAARANLTDEELANRRPEELPILGIERGYVRSTPLGDRFYQSVCQMDGSPKFVFENVFRDPEDAVTRVRASLAGQFVYGDEDEVP